MLVGINITSADALRRFSDFRASGLVDFAELTPDGFLHIDPREIAKEIDGCPIALHVMTSKFLNRDPEELEPLAKRLRLWIQALRPLYISDHIGCHEIGGQTLPQAIEVHYSEPRLMDRVKQWQRMLQCDLLLENYPSDSHDGHAQIDLFKHLIAEPKLGLLFDVSNAVVAERNGGGMARDWQSLTKHISACHISGYRPSKLAPSFTVDSHDCEVSDESWQLLEHFISCGCKPSTLVVERDEYLDDDHWEDDLQRARTYAK